MPFAKQLLTSPLYGAARLIHSHFIRRLATTVQETQVFFTLKALIASSDAQTRQNVRKLLQALALNQISEAEDAAAALAAIHATRFDLILCDMNLAPADGIAFTRLLRLSETSPNPYLPLILIASLTDRQSVEAARDAGVTEILAKPIAAQGLAARITEIVERPRSFVRCQSYFGPDRRRRRDDGYAGPRRRQDDTRVNGSL